MARTYKVFKNELTEKKVLDYGCGRFVENIIEFCFENEIKIFLYDKFNEKYNKLHKEDFDVVLCNNVLNVIKSDKTLKEVINELLDFNCFIIIKIYEGNKSGDGNITRINTYQRNLKTKKYLNYIKTDREIKFKGNFILIN